MKSLDLMKHLERYFDRDNLVLTSDKNVYRLRRKKDINHNSIISGQLLCSVDLYDGRLVVVSYDDGLTHIVQSFLDREGLTNSVLDGSPTHIYIYPNANKELLGIQAQPTQGNVQIIQGEYAITHANDPNPILSTFGIASCVGLLLYDPQLKLGGIAHVDFKNQVIPTLRKMLEELDVFDAQKLVFGRTPNIDPIIRDWGIMPRYGGRFFSEIELPEKFSFDTRTGVVGPYQPSEDPTLDKRMGEKTDHRFKEHIRLCFPVYRPKISPK
ncbi:MAG: hypothetical protein QXU40_01775 [Candidatus Pacearchaeota archaeon]